MTASPKAAGVGAARWRRDLLELSYAMTCELSECAPDSRVEYLADYIFDFTTYDGAMGSEFGRKAVEVCAAINDRRTFDYIKNPDNYRWYLLMCNMPFFADKLEWGTSIRGAWWNHAITFSTCGLWWSGESQIVEPLTFTDAEWREFIAALVEFATLAGAAE